MQNSALLRLCKEYAAGRVKFYDYRQIRAKMLQGIVGDCDDRTLPVEQVSGVASGDDEKTTPYEKTK